MTVVECAGTLGSPTLPRIECQGQLTIGNKKYQGWLTRAVACVLHAVCLRRYWHSFGDLGWCNLSGTTRPTQKYHSSVIHYIHICCIHYIYVYICIHKYVMFYQIVLYYIISYYITGYSYIMYGILHYSIFVPCPAPVRSQAARSRLRWSEARGAEWGSDLEEHAARKNAGHGLCTRARNGRGKSSSERATRRWRWIRSWSVHALHSSSRHLPQWARIPPLVSKII